MKFFAAVSTCTPNVSVNGTNALAALPMDRAVPQTVVRARARLMPLTGRRCMTEMPPERPDSANGEHPRARSMFSMFATLPTSFTASMTARDPEGLARLRSRLGKVRDGCNRI